jgi:hypothetical protein
VGHNGVNSSCFRYPVSSAAMTTSRRRGLHSAKSRSLRRASRGARGCSGCAGSAGQTWQTESCRSTA